MSSSAPAPPTELEPVLRGILGDALDANESGYAVDGMTPGFVATPGSVEELAAALAAANEHHAAVVPWGGGLQMALGNAPARYDVALRTAKLDRVLEHEPADMTLAVEAGITMGRLQALLAEQGQFLPIDAPDESTIGGVLAAGVSGPSRHAYGLPRDWLLGCRVAHADGSVSKGGGRVVKNVAGYDLPKLAVGSLGTLGVIVEATFKVAPLPAAQESLLATFSSLDEAAEMLFAADQRGLALRAVALADARAASTLPAGLPIDPEGALAACWLAGPRSAVERTARELADLAGAAETRRLEGDASERWWSRIGQGAEIEDNSVDMQASLPPSAVVGFMRDLTALVDEAGLSSGCFAFPTTGLVRVSLADAPAERQGDLIESARALATGAGGTLLVTSAPVAVKERIDVWGDAGSASWLMRQMKEQFDPRGTLNPGRFVGRL